MEQVIQTIIVCVTLAWISRLVSRQVHTSRLSRSHLASFNRRAENLLETHRIRLESINQVQEARLSKVEEEVKKLTNAVAFKR
jgi:hypothetical protein